MDEFRTHGPELTVADWARIYGAVCMALNILKMTAGGDAAEAREMERIRNVLAGFAEVAEAGVAKERQNRNLSPKHEARYTLIRIDDNGVEYVIQGNLTHAEAQAAYDRLTKWTHKQHYRIR